MMDVYQDAIISAVKSFGGRRHDETYVEALARYASELPVEISRLKQDASQLRAQLSDAKWDLLP